MSRLIANQATAVDEPAVLASLFFRQAFFLECCDEDVRDPYARFTSTQEQEFLVGQFLARDPHRRNNAGHGYGTSTLNVVVEEAGVFPIVLQQSERVRVAEILDLDEDAGEYFLRSLDEFVEQFVVFLAAQTVALDAVIERVIEELLIVGAHVKHHGQALGRRYAGASGVQRELADRDTHPLCALVAETQDSFAISYDDDPGILVRPVLQDLLDAALVLQ